MSSSTTRSAISDLGMHFTKQVYLQSAYDQLFIHVLNARQRPRSNGMTESDEYKNYEKTKTERKY